MRGIAGGIDIVIAQRVERGGNKFEEWYSMSLDEYAYHQRMEKLNADKVG